MSYAFAPLSAGLPGHAIGDEASTAQQTDWPHTFARYALLERMTGNPMVSLDQLGVAFTVLQSDVDQQPGVPTVAEYLPQVVAAEGIWSPGAHTAPTGGPDGYRIRRPALNTIAASDIEALQHQLAATARSRRNSRHGRPAEGLLALPVQGDSVCRGR